MQKNQEFRAPPPKCLTFLRTTLTKMIVRQNDRLALQENEIHQNDRSFCRKATVEAFLVTISERNTVVQQC